MSETITNNINQALTLDSVIASLNDFASGVKDELNLCQLKDALLEIQREMLAISKAREEATILKKDLAARIWGMNRAVSACKVDTVSDELCDPDALPKLSAAALIKEYRLTCARFRDTFPGGFANLLHSGATPSSKRWDDYQSS